MTNHVVSVRLGVLVPVAVAAALVLFALYFANNVGSQIHHAEQDRTAVLGEVIRASDGATTTTTTLVRP